MPVCKKCNNSFPNTLWIDGKLRYLNRRTQCLDCLPFDAERTVPYLQRKGVDPSGKRVCENCSKPFNYNSKKGFKRKICKSCQSNKHKTKFSKRCVDHKGGQCLICSYSKCTQGLCFHHLDPSIKFFNIGGSHCRKWEIVKSEVDKCVLLCHNCHSEFHAGLITTEQLLDLESRRAQNCTESGG